MHYLGFGALSAIYFKRLPKEQQTTGIINSSESEIAPKCTSLTPNVQTVKVPVN